MLCKFPKIKFFLTITGLYYLHLYVQIDYGFWGILTPVFASVFDLKNINTKSFIKKLDNYYIRITLMSIGLIMLTIFGFDFQWACLLSIPLLLLYSEKRGRIKLKYFFYIFYPLHLVILQGIQMLLTLLK